MKFENINSFDDLLEWLDTDMRKIQYDDVAKDILKIQEERERKERRRIRRKLGRQQRAIQKYVKVNDELPF